MMCAHPVFLTCKTRPVPCGRCMNCRVNRKRFWMGRMLMEWKSHSLPSWFLTLTYDDVTVPKVLSLDGNVDLTLKPEDFRLWTVRYRRKFGPMRYFGVGEYGDRTQRPHYHAVLFGVSEDVVEARIRATWKAYDPETHTGHGFSMVSEVNEARVAYVAQYTVKKLNAQNGKLGARYPEFARMSRFPPLGAAQLLQMRDQLLTKQGAAAMAALEGIVPVSWRYKESMYPIGAYWRRWLAEETGYAYKADREEALPETYELDVERAQWIEAKALRQEAAKGEL